MGASVIVCARDRADVLGRCLESVAAQLGRADELIVVDDGSLDGTPAEGERWSARAEEAAWRLIWRRHPRPLGVSAARQTGIAAAGSDRLLFLDSDCEARPGWAAALAAALDDAEAASGPVEEPPPRGWADLAFFGGASVGRGRLQGRPLVGCNMAFRAEALASQPFDPQLTYGADEDDVARRLAAQGARFAFAPDAVVIHHHHVTLRSYLAMAWRLGRGVGRYRHKHRELIGRDLWPLMLAALTLPLAAWRGGLAWWIPAAALGLQLALQLANELMFKRKRAAVALLATPLATLFSAVKLGSLLAERARLLLGGPAQRRDEPPVR